MSSNINIYAIIQTFLQAALLTAVNIYFLY